MVVTGLGYNYTSGGANAKEKSGQFALLRNHEIIITVR